MEATIETLLFFFLLTCVKTFAADSDNTLLSIVGSMAFMPQSGYADGLTDIYVLNVHNEYIDLLFAC